MTVDERFSERWRGQRQEHQLGVRERSRLTRQGRLATVALSRKPVEGSPLDAVDSRYRALWQRARQETWRAEEGDLSHEAYLLWWRENGGEAGGYTLAHHAEKQMAALGRLGMFRGHSPVQVFDWLLSRYGPLLAAEGFRRWLAAHADDADQSNRSR